jgi:hypothetical protein
MKRQGRAKKRTSAKLRNVIRQAWREYDEHGGVPHEQFWHELAKEMSPRKKKSAGAG